MAFKLCAACQRRKEKQANGAKPKRSANYSRTKGLSFERFVAKKFRRIYPNAGRQLEFQSAHALGTDLEGTGEFRVQCKAFKHYAPISALREVQICPLEGGTAVLITKGDREPPVAVLDLEAFLLLVRHAEAWRRRNA